MSTVGSVLINFSAATAGYFAGSKSVKEDAGSIVSTFGGVGGVITGAFAAVGGALSVGALVAGLKSAGAEITNLAHTADRLSVSTEQFSRLNYAAKQTGVDTESLSRAMLKSQEEIGKAATEGGDAADKLGKMGFNVKELINMNPGDQFRSIAQTIANIQNPAQRAAAEVAIFGKAGAELKPLLEQGAAGLDRMATEADKLGITLSSVDAANTTRAGQAVQKVQDTVSGLTQHIAAGLAPVVEDISDRIIAWAEAGNRMQHIVSGALEAVSYGAAFAADVFKLGKAGIEIFGAAGTFALASLVIAFDAVAHAGAWVAEKLFGSHIDTSGIDNAADHLIQKSKELAIAAGNDAGEVFSGQTAAKVFQYFDSVQQAANKTSQEAVKAKEAMGTAFVPPTDAENNIKKITETLAELHKQVDEFGLSEGAKKLAELKLLGASQDQQAEAKALADQLDQMRQQADVAKELDKLRKDARQAGMDESGKQVDNLKAMGATADQISEAMGLQKQIEATNAAKAEARRLDEEAKKAKEDALTPLQREQEELRKLQQLYETGRISAQQYASAAAKKETELHGESHTTEKAVTRGSQDAFNLMNEINKRVLGGGDKKQQIAQAQLNAQLKANQLLQQQVAQTKPKPPQQVRLAIA